MLLLLSQNGSRLAKIHYITPSYKKEGVYKLRKEVKHVSLELKKYEKKSYIRRSLVSWVTIICIVLCFFILMPKKVFADDAADAQNEVNAFINYKTVADDFVDILQDLTNGVFLQASVDTFYDGTVGGTNIVESILDDINNGSITFMAALTLALKAVGMLMIVYNLLLNLSKELARGQMTTESWLRILIAFVIPCVLIIEYDVIIDGFSKLGTWLYESLYDNSREPFAGTKSSISGKKMPDWDKYGLTKICEYVGKVVEYVFAWIKGFLLTFVYLIVNVFILLIIFAGILSNFVEIVIRHLFMPVAIANVSHDGVRSAGVRYIKKYLGCYMKIGTIMAAVSCVFYVYRKVCSIDSLPGIYSLLFFFLLIPAMKQGLKMTNEIINDAIGV